MFRETAQCLSRPGNRKPPLACRPFFGGRDLFGTGAEGGATPGFSATVGQIDILTDS